MSIDLATLATFLLSLPLGFVLLKRMLVTRRATGTETPVRLAAPLPTTSAGAGLQLDLWRAGYYHPSARRNFLILRVTLLLASVTAAAVLIFLTGPGDIERSAPIAIAFAVVAAVAFSIPRLHLARQARKRVERIGRALPDALDTITMCISGGLSLENSLERVAGEFRATHPDLSTELSIIYRQARIGSLGQALRQFAKRIDAPDVRSLTSVVTHAERLGTDVAAALYGYADSIRRKNRQRAEERANKTGIRMLFPLVFCLAPSVFLLLWGPALLQVRDFFRVERGANGVLSQSLPSGVTWETLINDSAAPGTAQPLTILSGDTPANATPSGQ